MMKIRRKINTTKMAGRVYYRVNLPPDWVKTLETLAVELDIGRRDIVIRPAEEGQ